jgi:transposase
MDRAYEGDETREFAKKQGFIVVVPPKKNRKHSWEYDKELYKSRNEIERFFLRIKRFRKVFTRYDKLDIIYTGVIIMALIYDALLM